MSNTAPGGIPRITQEPLATAERELMAHRYLYYVLCTPRIDDSSYDLMDKSFLEYVPMDGPIQSILHKPGSDLAEHYTEEEIARAIQLLGKKKRKRHVR